GKSKDTTTARSATSSERVEDVVNVGAQRGCRAVGADAFPVDRDWGDALEEPALGGVIDFLEAPDRAEVLVVEHVVDGVVRSGRDPRRAEALEPHRGRVTSERLRDQRVELVEMLRT